MPLTNSRPVVEQIAVALFDRLKQLEAGYKDTSLVSEVVRPLRFGGYTPKHMQIVLTQDEPTQLPELSYPGNPPAVAWQQRFHIRCHLMPSELDPIPLDEYVNIFASDVIEVVTGVGSGWHTFGGLAIDSSFDSLEMIEADGGVDGCNLPLRVIYRVSERSPYQGR